MMETSFILQTVFFVPGELKPMHFLNIHSRFAFTSVRKTITKRLKRRQFGLHSDGEQGEAPVFAGYYRLRALAVSGGRLKMCSGGRDDDMKKTLTRDGSLHTGWERLKKVGSFYLAALLLPQFGSTYFRVTYNSVSRSSLSVLTHCFNIIRS